MTEAKAVKSWREIGADDVERAIRARGTEKFRASELGAEIGCSKRTIYRKVRVLRERGHRIEGHVGFGFMARMLPVLEAGQ